MVEINIYQTTKELKGLGRKVMENEQTGISVTKDYVFKIFAEYELSKELIDYRRQNVREKNLPTNIFVSGDEVYFSIYGKEPLIIGIKDAGLTKRITEYLSREKTVRPEEIGAKSEDTIDSCCF